MNTREYNGIELQALAAAFGITGTVKEGGEDIANEECLVITYGQAREFVDRAASIGYSVDGSLVHEGFAEVTNHLVEISFILDCFEPGDCVVAATKIGELSGANSMPAPRWEDAFIDITEELPPVDGTNQFLGVNRKGEYFVFNYHLRVAEGLAGLQAAAREDCYPATFRYDTGVESLVGKPVKWRKLT